MSDYTLSPSSQRDLIAAALYATEKAQTPDAGDRVIRQLTGVMEALAEFPSLGRARDDVRPGVRSFPSNPFILFYRITRKGIHVLRILHQRQDVETVFPPPAPG